MLKPDGSQGFGNRDLAGCLDEARKRKVMVRIHLKRDGNIPVNRWSWVVKVKKDRVVVIRFRPWRIGEVLSSGLVRRIRRIFQILIGRYYHQAYGFPLGSAWERETIALSAISKAVLPSETFEVGSPTIH